MTRLMMVTLAAIAICMGCGAERPEPTGTAPAAENRDVDATTSEPLAQRREGREPTVDEVLREVIACLETRGRDEVIDCAAPERKLSEKRLAELKQRYEKAEQDLREEYEARGDEMTLEEFEELMIEAHRSALASR